MATGCLRPSRPPLPQHIKTNSTEIAERVSNRWRESGLRRDIVKIEVLEQTGARTKQISPSADCVAGAVLSSMESVTMKDSVRVREMADEMFKNWIAIKEYDDERLIQFSTL